MERKIDKVVTLLRKASSGTLKDDERQAFERLLEDKDLREVYDDVNDDTYLEKHFAGYERFSPDKAYDMFRIQQRKSRIRLMIRRVAVAACFIIPLLGIWMWVSMERSDEKTVPVTLAKKESVQLRLSNGQIVNVNQENAGEIKEQGGAVIHNEDGKLSYRQDTIQIKGGEQEGNNELIVPFGGECYVVLDDGTRVWVNAGSRIKYPVRFSKERRVVTVEGEVYFDVTKDGRPFVVKTDLGDISVLGTSFGVRAYKEEEALTTLVSGKVRFTGKKGESVELTPGEQAVVSLAGNVIKRDVKVEEYVGWKDGWYIFREKPLEQVMETLARWYDVTVFYQNQGVKDIKFTGNLKRYESIQTFLEVLAGSEEVKYKLDGNTVILYK